MANMPQYKLEKSLLPRLSEAMRAVSLDVQQIGLPKTITEGIEQQWRCGDESGDLFIFGTCEVNENNAVGLKSGAVHLAIGPPAQKRARKDVSEAFNRFERALISLGAERMGQK